ncbi:hypothetical protein BJ508DRAFT_306399 [Ascobolus immersus RN42]|uniref:Uncharacterized protein n=1 Tax=Ascobolus immersus RN42 TaxID=1160509 RepID=A0A3N4IA63_ASCIM|nr:hypothetical protein BJ508DRAFT_306399 [Ascobolus immersus RN42]
METQTNPLAYARYIIVPGIASNGTLGLTVNGLTPDGKVEAPVGWLRLEASNFVIRDLIMVGHFVVGTITKVNAPFAMKGGRDNRTFTFEWLVEKDIYGKREVSEDKIPIRGLYIPTRTTQQEPEEAYRPSETTQNKDHPQSPASANSITTGTAQDHLSDPNRRKPANKDSKGGTTVGQAQAQTKQKLGQILGGISSQAHRNGRRVAGNNATIGRARTNDGEHTKKRVRYNDEIEEIPPLSTTGILVKRPQKKTKTMQRLLEDRKDRTYYEELESEQDHDRDGYKSGDTTD